MIDWTQAACSTAGVDPDAFFPPNGKVPPSIAAICVGCDIRNECLDWALHHEAFGYWGGTSEDDRQTMRRRAGIVLDRPEAGRAGTMPDCRNGHKRTPDTTAVRPDGKRYCLTCEREAAQRRKHRERNQKGLLA